MKKKTTIVIQKHLKNVIHIMEDLFAKAPALPKNIQEFLVKILPILSLVLAVIGILNFASGISGGITLSTLCTLAANIVLIFAFDKLKNRKYSGWELAFGSEILHILSFIFALELISAIISAVIGFYLLFQIKSYYK